MLSPLTRAAEGLLRRAFTIAELEHMAAIGVIAPDERLELLCGDVVPMSRKSALHEGIRVPLNMLWSRNCPADFVVAGATGLRLDEHNYFEPDFIIWSRKTRYDDVKGPDVLLAVEVADSSLRYDLDRKPLVYAGFGVRELWVIDAERRVVHCHSESSSAGYSRIGRRGDADRLTPIFAPAAFAFSLNELDFA
jgi:Uma2 family endonuclease